MIGSLLQADFEEIIAARDWDGLREALSELDSSDIAELIIDLPPEVEGIIFRVLPRERAADVFEHLPIDHQQSLITSLSGPQVNSILNEMTPDDRTRLFEELPAEATRRLIEQLSPDELKAARELLGYAPGTAGRYMTPEYVALPPDITAREALDRIRKTGRGKETLNVIYIINEKGRLLEDLRLGSLVLADPEMMIGDIEDRPLASIPATAPVGDLIDAFEQYDRVALPVVDKEMHMLGIVTHDDVLEFAEKRATREMQQLGGSEALDAPYFDVGFWSMAKKRGGWLAILFLGEMLTATAMGYFEGEIEKAAVVALFVPLIISSGGNSGSQGTSLIIRSLALKEIRLRDWWRVFGRELRTGLALGLFLGVIGMLRITAWQGLSHVPAVGSFFQTHGSQDEQRIPDGMKLVTADSQLDEPVPIPAFTIPKDAQISRGMIVPVETALPKDVRTMVRSHEHPTAYGRHWLLIGITVLFALIGVVTWGSLAGSMLPFILRRLGFDPATSSAPFVATLVDVTGLIIYFGVAKIVLSGDSIVSPDMTALNQGYTAARAICRRGLPGIAFPAAFLPREKRNAVLAVLSLCVRIRQTTGSGGAHLIEILRDRMNAISADSLELPLPEMRSEDQHALHAAAQVIRRYQVPTQDFLEFAGALQSPVKRFATWPSLENHCQSVSGSIARIVASVLGMTHSDGADRATKLGVAIELTRILRALKSDLSTEKLYLPLTDLALARYSERDLLAGTINDAFGNLIKLETGRARELYREATEAIPWLADDGSQLFAGLIIATGLNVLDQMERRWRELLENPPKISVSQMIRQLPKAWCIARQ